MISRLSGSERVLEELNAGNVANSNTIREAQTS
jgi:hypothetical protein